MHTRVNFLKREVPKPRMGLGKTEMTIKQPSTVYSVPISLIESVDSIIIESVDSISRADPNNP